MVGSQIYLNGWPSDCRDAPWCIRHQQKPDVLIIGCTRVHPYNLVAFKYDFIFNFAKVRIKTHIRPLPAIQFLPIIPKKQ